MEIIKKYTAIQLNTKNVDNSIEINLSYGRITGPYYSQEYPEESFNTEEEAINYAYKTNEYVTWLIVPIITFN